MQISIMEISMSLNGNLGVSWGITQPTEKIIMFKVSNEHCYVQFEVVPSAAIGVLWSQKVC